MVVRQQQLAHSNCFTLQLPPFDDELGVSSSVLPSPLRPRREMTESPLAEVAVGTELGIPISHLSKSTISLGLRCQPAQTTAESPITS